MRICAFSRTHKLTPGMASKVLQLHKWARRTIYISIVFILVYMNITAYICMFESKHVVMIFADIYYVVHNSKIYVCSYIEQVRYEFCVLWKCPMFFLSFLCTNKYVCI